MSGVNKIKERILDEARLQAEETTKRAKKEASEIITDAKKEAEDKKNKIIENAKAEAVEVKKRLKAVAELEARKQKLQAKQEVVEEAFENTIKKLTQMPDEEYISIITDLIVGSVRNGTEEVVLSEKDKKRLPSDFTEKINKKLSSRNTSGKVTVSSETRNINGGFILKLGDIEVNNSFDSIIRMKRDEIETDVIKSLF
ncbi:V-type ATP synthase subunit E family protein [Herbivorax sp. ANBcel31]|uniref:V-type ATP synthase subunit E n=1 Tax=Herbivorax sp. ANBcel31 TaxID=3069754 RepID=UPI0027B2FD94|nr:V-type ATP synthase subunit E family protein [Herbivorax sp. ANBcel31]MDQ2085125.1 V-type ATP synthase subunit E family protein [Herbivorax sp. ANBcel31]